MHACTHILSHAGAAEAPYKAIEKNSYLFIKKSAGMYPLTGPDYWTELFSLFGQVQTASVKTASGFQQCPGQNNRHEQKNIYNTTINTI